MKKLLHTLLFLLLALPVAGMVIAAAEQGTGSDSASTACCRSVPAG
jgi:multisubunit Na+/H+ antiporter MnhG subunit